jgi:predicted nucleic acid-binding protein
MTLIVDAGVFVAAMDRREANHAAAAALLRDTTESIATSQLVVTEVDHLLRARYGSAPSELFRRDLADGAFDAECLSPEELSVAAAVAGSYDDLGLGLADASLVVLAARHDERRLATLDLRHFRAVRPLQGGAFTLLPADGSSG